MRRLFIGAFLILLFRCESIGEREFENPIPSAKPKDPPYVVECLTQREHAEIDIYSHIWRIKIRFSKEKVCGGEYLCL